jgi:hypothetical protein
MYEVCEELNNVNIVGFEEILQPIDIVIRLLCNVEIFQEYLYEMFFYSL